MKKNQKHTKETIKKIKNKSKSKAVVQLTLTGKFVNVFSSMREAEKLSGVFRSNIRRSCNRTGGIILANGYLWNYLNNGVDLDNLKKESKK